MPEQVSGGSSAIPDPSSNKLEEPSQDSQCRVCQIKSAINGASGYDNTVRNLKPYA